MSGRTRELVPVRLPMAGGCHEAVIVIEREDGLTGLGEAPVIAERGDSLSGLWDDLGTGAPARPAARCALETARLDLAARRRGVPLAVLLGGVHRSRVECSALVTAVPPDRVAAEAERRAGTGFRTLKLKAADAGGMLDQERLGAARWAAGPDARLRLDFNCRLEPDRPAARLAGLRPFRLELLEQPLPAAAPLSEWLVLAAAAPAPLAADESLADPGLAAELAAAGVALAAKLASLGGPLRACELAAGAAGRVSLGSSFETSIGLAAALHVACALEREPLACGLATGWLLDDDLARGLHAEGAWLELSSAPGLGVELDRRALDLYRLDR